MSAQRLAREYPTPSSADGEELAELLVVIQRESSRINQTVQQFLDYARPRPLNRQHVLIQPWLDQLARTADAVASGRGVRVVARCQPGLTAWIDAAQLQEAIDNLYRNAIDASPQGGTVILEAVADGSDVAVSVTDGGPGIAADVLPRIFDLYFTTKAQGTGIGLAVAQQIVTAHGGTIEVESRPGAGTHMRVRIPAEEAAGG